MHRLPLNQSRKAINFKLSKAAVRMGRVRLPVRMRDSEHRWLSSAVAYRCDSIKVIKLFRGFLATVPAVLDHDCVGTIPPKHSEVRVIGDFCDLARFLVAIEYQVVQLQRLIAVNPVEISILEIAGV